MEFRRLTKNQKLMKHDGVETLYILALANKPLFVHILLQSGLDANSTAGKGSTPLISAASCGHVAIMEILVEAGADVNHLADDSTGALTEAIVFEHPDAVAYLLANGARPVAEGREVSDYEAALRTHNKKIIRLLNSWEIKN